MRNKLGMKLRNNKSLRYKESKTKRLISYKSKLLNGTDNKRKKRRRRKLLKTLLTLRLRNDLNV